MRKLADAGATLALPVVAGRGKPLIMRAYAFGQELNSGVWGIREPKDDAPEVDPDILIVPLAAFDRRGNRIGYGAGYYDMTINRLRALKPVIAVGIAYAAQEVPEVPVTARDARLDLVLTEREMIDFRRTLRHANSLHRRHRRAQRAQHPARPAAEADRRMEARPRRRQRRERRRRLRHHRGDLQRVRSTPAPTPSRSAITPGTSARRWCSSSARRG